MAFEFGPEDLYCLETGCSVDCHSAASEVGLESGAVQVMSPPVVGGVEDGLRGDEGEVSQG